MSPAESRRARGFFCLYAAVEFLRPFILAGLLVLLVLAPAVRGMLQAEQLLDKAGVMAVLLQRLGTAVLMLIAANEVTRRCESPKSLTGVRKLGCFPHLPTGLRLR